MCDHGVYCEHCPDYYGEMLTMRERSYHYRHKCIAQQETIEKLRNEDYVKKLKALNTHLTTKCAALQRDNEQLFEAFRNIKGICLSLEHQCHIFAEIYSRAANKDDSIRAVLLAIMEELDVKPALLLK
jgi:hypothetical protein